MITVPDPPLSLQTWSVDMSATTLPWLVIVTSKLIVAPSTLVVGKLETLVIRRSENIGCTADGVNRMRVFGAIELSEQFGEQLDGSRPQFPRSFSTPIVPVGESPVRGP